MKPQAKIQALVKGIEFACIRIGMATTIEDRDKWMKVRRSLRERFDDYLEHTFDGSTAG